MNIQHHHHYPTLRQSSKFIWLTCRSRHGPMNEPGDEITATVKKKYPSWNHDWLSICISQFPQLSIFTYQASPGEYGGVIGATGCLRYCRKTVVDSDARVVLEISQSCHVEENIVIFFNAKVFKRQSTVLNLHSKWNEI